MDATRLRRPRLGAADAERLAAERYGVRGRASELPSERDQNFRLLPEDGGEPLVLKIAREGEDGTELDLQDRARERAARALPGRVQRLVRTTDGGARTEIEGPDGRRHWLRALTWLGGAPLAAVRPHSPALLRDLGACVGAVGRALDGLEAPAVELVWNLRGAPGAVHRGAAAVESPELRELLLRMAAGFDADRADAALRRGVVHNDANDHNVLVAEDLEGQRVSGLIDFGDLVESWVLADVAVAAAYAMLGKRDPLAAAAHVVAGCHAACPIPEAELGFLLDLIALRLSVSVVVAAEQGRAEPDRPYLRVSEAPARALLEVLAATPPALAHALFRGACGLEPCAAAAEVRAWLAAHAGELRPVLATDLRRERWAPVDLSVGSAELAAALAADPADGERLLAERRAREGVAVLLGHYDEPRACYAGELFAHAAEDREERRTVHLGVDLFAEPGSAVHAPLDGAVHDVRDNAGAFDYGPTVVLRHEPRPGLVFFSLYGHLARPALASLAPGRRVAAGEAFAAVGRIHENGGWPPHLHLQLLADDLGLGAQCPGVAPPSRRAAWRSLAPDAGLLLGLTEPTRAEVGAAALRERREQHLGPSLSLSYRRPLALVRGSGTWLYDTEGRAYLDAVNNVPHVGHAHPRVVRAGAAQMALLNTNTRYLHPLLAEYVERLTALFPAPLEVAFLVCSGSEANELALRIARAATGSRDTIVLAAGYHGNTTTLVECSPYKLAGPGGSAPPPHVRVVPLPDPYRGPHRGADAGERYAEAVREACADCAAGGGRPTFLAESLPGCGGQIVPPPGYLAAAYAAVREAGGVVLADEVQTGFGRVGTRRWAFELQDVVPDVVTLGKPIGNGHPLGAVVTTRALAERFANGMEYFNTFGGNPVSCAVGLAVLDVIEEEGLQENARRTGALLRTELRALADRHPLVGDVRGAGLYLGVELVLDREARTPAPGPAAYVAERLRDKGVLVGVDGPDRDVLKIKPPLVFGPAEAHALVRALDEVLSETVLGG